MRLARTEPAGKVYSKAEMARVLKQRLTIVQARERARRLGWRNNPATLAEDVTKGVVEVIDGKTVFRLRWPINLGSRRDGPYVLISYEPLGIEEHGKTEQEALEAFAYHFGALWNGIAQADDRNLTKDARKLKREMRSLVDFAFTRS